MDFNKKSLELHKENQGKVSVTSKVVVETLEDLSTAYTPGVAEPCRKINENPEMVYDYTAKGNLVAVVSDGTAVLGLGDIGPEAAMPVMEGKAILFKSFADVDAFPVCMRKESDEKLIEMVQALEPTFGGVNLEDIGAPACFIIEKALKDSLDIPVFHDDQHGTAIVVLAGLENAMKLVGKRFEDVKVAVNGAGAAATSITKLLLHRGVKNAVVCDRSGALHSGRTDMDPYKEELMRLTNPNGETGSLAEVLKGADIFIGVSAGNVATAEMIQEMNEDAIVFAMANPIPEIMPEDARKGGARVIATGRSDFPNQVNNVLAFPGIFRGALDARASDINEEMKVAAAGAIADIIKEDEIREEYVIPDAFDARVAVNVAVAVAEAAIQSGVSRKDLDLEAYRQEVEARLRRG